MWVSTIDICFLNGETWREGQWEEGGFALVTLEGHSTTIGQSPVEETQDLEMI